MIDRMLIDRRWELSRLTVEGQIDFESIMLGITWSRVKDHDETRLTIILCPLPFVLIRIVRTVSWYPPF